MKTYSKNFRENDSKCGLNSTIKNRSQTTKQNVGPLLGIHLQDFGNTDLGRLIGIFLLLQENIRSQSLLDSNYLPHK